MRHVPQRLLFGLVLAVGLLVISAPRASAGECDLYTTSSSCLFADNALFDKTDLTFTNDLLTTAAPTVTVKGIAYRQFFLDINEPTTLNGNKNYLTLDQIETYQSDTASLNGRVSSLPGGSLSSATKIWDMDPALQTSSAPAGTTTGTVSGAPTGDNWINLDYVLTGGGSGYGDMVMYIPNELFSTQKYVYLYSQFGCTNTADGGCAQSKYGSGNTQTAATQFPSQAGLKEWWIKVNLGSGPSTPVPEPGTLALVATGIAMAVRKRRKSTQQ